MPDEPDSEPQPDTGLEQVRDLVARVLEFVAADPERLARFVRLTSFQPGSAGDMARSPLFMLSVLDSAAKDEQLLHGLSEEAQIKPVMIELARARLAFHVIAESARPDPPEEDLSAASERIRRQLRVLLRLSRGQ